MYITALASEIEDGGFDYKSVHDNGEDAYRAAVKLANQHPVDIPCVLTYNGSDFDEEYVETSFMGCYVMHKKEFEYYEFNEEYWTKSGDFMIKDYNGFDIFDANHELNQALNNDPLDCYIISTFYFDDEFSPKFIVNSKDDLLRHVKNLYFDLDYNVVIHKSDKNGVKLLEETYFYTSDNLSEEDIRKVIDNL